MMRGGVESTRGKGSMSKRDGSIQGTDEGKACDGLGSMRGKRDYEK